MSVSLIYGNIHLLYGMCKGLVILPCLELGLDKENKYGYYQY